MNIATRVVGEGALAPRPRRNPLSVVIRGDSLLRTGHLLTMSSLLTSATGAGYWALATRLYGPENVGRNYAAVSAMTLTSGIGQLNLPDVLIRFVPAAGARTRRLVLLAYSAATTATLAAALAFILLVPQLVPGLTFLRTPGLGAAFVLSTVVYSLFTLQDGVLTGLRRPGCVVVENAGFSLVKILSLVALIVTSAGILLSWTLALLAAVVGTNTYLFTRALRRRRRGAPEAPAATPTPIQQPTLGFIVAGYCGGMCGTAAIALPPLLVLNALGATQSAYFSLAWVVTQTLYLFNRNMGTSLVVEAARDSRGLHQLPHMLRHAGTLLVGCTIVLTAAAPLVLGVFGSEYAHHGTTLFRLLVLSALPDLVVATALSVSSALRRMSVVVVVYGALATLVVGLTAILLPVLGINAVGVAWLGAQSTVAVGLLLTRSMWLAKRPGPDDADV